VQEAALSTFWWQGAAAGSHALSDQRFGHGGFKAAVVEARRVREQRLLVVVAQRGSRVDVELEHALA
jgi:hypothetical protein